MFFLIFCNVYFDAYCSFLTGFHFVANNILSLFHIPCDSTNNTRPSNGVFICLLVCGWWTDLLYSTCSFPIDDWPFW